MRLGRRALLLLGGSLFGVVLWASDVLGGSAEARRAAILESIRFVESGGVDACPDGDGGAAIGPFQIHQPYWRDAVAQDPGLGPAQGFSYQDCRRRAYAERVVAAYMQRFVPEAWSSADAEVIARTHNGGPTGASKHETLRYWSKVKRELEARGR